MIYKTLQITDRFGQPINSGKTTWFTEQCLKARYNIGDTFWSNNLTDDNLSGEYVVIKRVGY